MYLLDTNVVSELRRPRPHGAVLEWIAGVPAEQLFVSAVTVGEIQAGIEITREQDKPKAEEIEAWLNKVLASYGVLPMDALAFREWARLMHRKSDAVSGDAMIAGRLARFSAVEYQCRADVPHRRQRRGPRRRGIDASWDRSWPSTRTQAGARQ